MEKYVPHYSLREIQKQMQTESGLNMTNSAKRGMRQLRVDEAKAVQIVQGLSGRNFYKSMTTYLDHRVWQDVYHCAWDGVELYIKFQRFEDYFVISFKERADG